MSLFDASQRVLPEDSPEPPLLAAPEWFCVHAQPKKVSIAAQSLRQLPGVDCFLPLLQFRRTRRQKPVLVTEPLFPGYLFARFVFRQSLRAVYYSQGVSRVIHFGDHWPIIPDDIIAQLQQAVGETGVKMVESPIALGDEVLINSGPFQNLSGLVSRVYPGRMRIAILMEFLGRQTMVEIPMSEVRSLRDVRQAVFVPPENERGN
jgi:transcriptional antiterminator RfaH